MVSLDNHINYIYTFIFTNVMTTEEQIRFWSLVLINIPKSTYGLCYIVSITYYDNYIKPYADNIDDHIVNRNIIYVTLQKNKPSDDDVFWWPLKNRLVRKRYVIRIIRELQGKKYTIWDWFAAFFI